MIIVLIIFLILLIVSLINLLRYFLIIKPNKIYRDDVQSQIDLVINEIVLKLGETNPELGINQENIVCKSLDDIWKKRIMVFEYSLKYNYQNINYEEIKNDIDQEIKIRTKNNSVKMKLTDFWISKNKINFDIAYLVNEKTKKYVSDIQKTE